MPPGMITQGTRLFEEDESPIASAIANILMQARAGGISPQQAAEFFKDMVKNGIPSQMIEKEIARDIDSVGEVFPVNQMTTDVRTPRPTMASYGDVRSVLSPGTSNIRVDQPDIGWPGEDLSGYSNTKFPAAEVLSPPVLANNFATTPPALPVDPFAFEDTKARAPRVEYQGSSGGLGNTRAMQEKAAFMAAAPTPVIAGDRHPPVSAPLQSRQVTQNDPVGLFRDFRTVTPYTGTTSYENAGYQTPREARRRPIHNRVPKSTPSGSSGGRRSSGPWRLLA